MPFRRRQDKRSTTLAQVLPSPKGRARVLALLVCTLGAWAGRAEAAEYCYFPDDNGTAFTGSRCDTQLIWPTTWTPVDAGMVETLEAGYASGFNLIQDTNYPGLYVAKMRVPAKGTNPGGTYLFFRMRTTDTTIGAGGDPYTGAKTAFWLITTTSPSTNNKPQFSIAWDMQGWPNHGLEMAYQDGAYTNGYWNETNFSDIDGNSGTRGTKEIDGFGTNNTNRGYEGYLRLSTGQPYSSGTSTFIDFAVACSYFTRVANVTYGPGGIYTFTFNPCTTAFYSAAALSSSINDNTAWAGEFATTDIFGRIGWDATTPVTAATWTGRTNPTAVVVAGVESRATARGVEVSFSTASEVGTAGFNLYRKDPASGRPIQVNRGLIPAAYGSPNGGRYRILDPGASPSGEAVYVLEEVEFQGTHREYGPFTVLPRRSHAGEGDPGQHAPGEALREVRTDDPGTARLDGPRKAGPLAARRQDGARGRGGSGARVVVSRTGLQVVRAADVATALGIAEPAARNLIRNGMLRITGPEGDVSCQPSVSGEMLYFVGHTLDTTWANTATYLLTGGRCRPFGSASVTPSRGGAPSAPTAFTDRSHLEQDIGPALTLFDEPDEDFWLWQYLLAGHSTMGSTTFDLPAPDATGGPGEVTLYLQGTTSTGAANEHHVRVSLGGAVIGESRWTGKTPVAASFTLPPGGLRAGAGNTLLVEAVLDGGVRYSGFALDSLDVSWERRARAAGDRLSLPAGVAGEIAADGFSGGDIWALDLTHPEHPVRLSGVVTIPRGGSWMVRVGRREGSGPLLLTRPAAASVPDVVPVVSRPALDTLEGRGADSLIITSPDLEIAAGRLAAIHGERGIRAVVVTTDRIYDRYTQGNLDPRAIRSFLAEVDRFWHRRPAFVVLVGSGTWDGRNILGLGDNHVPPLLVNTPNGLAVSDVALADVEGDDGVPEFAIGRIPASSEAELHGYLDKLENFGRAAGPWANRALFVADNADPGGDFTSDSQASMQRLDGRMDLSEASLAADPAATRAATLAALGEGLGILHYFGHAAGDRLAAEGLLMSADVDGLLNGGRAPLALLMTCSAGNFGFPGYDSLGVRLTLHPAGGAIATLGPSALELQADSRILSQEILSRLGSSPHPSFGEAVRRAMAASRDAGSPRSTRLTYNLFGDPSVAMAP